MYPSPSMPHLLSVNQTPAISDRFALLLGLSLGFVLSRRQGRLMTAESCTGGLISHWVTAIGGSSHWFDGAVVSYANATKQHLLSVSFHSLEEHGAVSEPVAREMVDGLQRQHVQLSAGSTVSAPLYGLSVTGIAGPQGGRPDKPVGLVWFGWSGPSGTQTACRQFAGGRAEIQRQAAAWAMAGLFARLSRLD